MEVVYSVNHRNFAGGFQVINPHICNDCTGVRDFVLLKY